MLIEYEVNKNMNEKEITKELEEKDQQIMELKKLL